jgi:hypothetical protein
LDSVYLRGIVSNYRREVCRLVWSISHTSGAAQNLIWQAGIEYFPGIRRKIDARLSLTVLSQEHAMFNPITLDKGVWMVSMSAHWVVILTGRFCSLKFVLVNHKCRWMKRDFYVH